MKKSELKDLKLSANILDQEDLESEISNLKQYKNSSYEKLDTIENTVNRITEVKDYSLDYDSLQQLSKCVKEIMLTIGGKVKDSGNIIDETFDTKVTLIAYSNYINVYLPQINNYSYDIAFGENENCFTTYDNYKDSYLTLPVGDICNEDNPLKITLYLGNSMTFIPFIRGAYVKSVDTMSEAYEKNLSNNIIVTSKYICYCDDSSINSKLSDLGEFPEVEVFRVSNVMTDLKTNQLSNCCPKCILFQEGGKLSAIETNCCSTSNITDIQLPNTLKIVGKACFGMSTDIKNITYFSGTSFYKDNVIASMTCGYIDSDITIKKITFNN